MQNEYNIELIQTGAQKFLFCVGLLFFVCSTGVTAYNMYLQKLHMQEIITAARQAAQTEEKDRILVVRPFKKLQKWEELAGGFHIPGFELSADENNWVNVAFARYYGIKGIRMVEEEKKDSAF